MKRHHHCLSNFYKAVIASDDGKQQLARVITAAVMFSAVISTLLFIIMGFTISIVNVLEGYNWRYSWPYYAGPSLLSLQFFVVLVFMLAYGLFVPVFIFDEPIVLITKWLRKICVFHYFCNLVVVPVIWLTRLCKNFHSQRGVIGEPSVLQDALKRWGIPGSVLSPQGFLVYYLCSIHFNTGRAIARCEASRVMYDMLRGLRALRAEPASRAPKRVWACTQHHDLAEAIGMETVSLHRCNPFIWGLALLCEVSLLSISAVEFYRGGKLRKFGYPRAYALPIAELPDRPRSRKLRRMRTAQGAAVGLPCAPSQDRSHTTEA